MSWKGRVIQVVLFILGLVLLVLFFRDQDFASLQKRLSQGDYRWTLPVFLVTFLNHWFRAKRWEMLIQPLGYPTHTQRTLAALLFGYLVSYVVPRLGEVIRCGVLAEKKTNRFVELFGTVIVERAIDVCCLLLVGLAAFIIEYDRLITFGEEVLFASLQASSEGKAKVLAVAIGVLLLIAVVLYFLAKRYFWAMKAKAFLIRFQAGMSSLFRIKGWPLFFIYTLFIWAGYFGMTYLWFFAFKGSQSLSASVGLAMVFIGGVARSLPIQGGGMGAYHTLFTAGILLFGASELTGATLAVTIHGFQSVFYLIGGGISWIYLLWEEEA